MHQRADRSTILLMTPHIATSAANTSTSDPFAAAEASAARTGAANREPRHEIAVVLGSGWAPAADALGTVVAEVPLDELGGFPAPAVAGHVAVVRSVSLDGTPILVFLGRVHLYEGHPLAAVVHGVRTAIAAGCQDRRSHQRGAAGSGRGCDRASRC